jgi:hypothetical protein
MHVTAVGFDNHLDLRLLTSEPADVHETEARDGPPSLGFAKFWRNPFLNVHKLVSLIP